jgi:hypothetical protein
MEDAGSVTGMASTSSGAELDRLRSERTYRSFGPEDDDFHDQEMSDRWWETETCWFSWNVPERSLGGWVYCQARPNANLCNGGAWIWDDHAAFPWELAYRAEYSGLQLPPRHERDMRDFEWPNGVHVRVLEPLSRYAISYVDPGALELELVFDAFMAPNAHPEGVAPFVKGAHFDQAGRVTGTMVLHGERIPIDCYSVRDRSWGPRPLGRPKRTPGGLQPPSKRGFGGVGYSFGVAGPGEAWLVYALPGAEAETVVCGFLVRRGEYAHILAGQRRVRYHPHTGWPLSFRILAMDDQNRHLSARGEAMSRHWRGHGGDSLVRWRWDDGVDGEDGCDGWGEDQSYFNREQWEANRRRAAGIGPVNS